MQQNRLWSKRKWMSSVSVILLLQMNLVKSFGIVIGRRYKMDHSRTLTKTIVFGQVVDSNTDSALHFVSFKLVSLQFLQAILLYHDFRSLTDIQWKNQKISKSHVQPINFCTM